MWKIFSPSFWKRRSAEAGGGRPLTQERGKPRIGLALSSGAARGLAHVGVLEMLEEEGIEISAIGGSSMGAYVGALWAAGYSGKQLEELAAEMSDRRNLWKLADPVLLPVEGLFRGEKAKRHLARSLGELKFEDLERELLVVTFDLDSGERLVVRSGSVVDAVHASCAMPGIIAPVKFGKHRCSDGGVVDPVPVGALRHYTNVDVVIAVSVLPSLSDVDSGRTRQDDDVKRGLLRRGLSGLNRRVNLMASGNVIDTFRKSIRAAQIRMAEESCRRADLCIRPAYVATSWHAYDQFERLIEGGRAATRARLDDIRALAEGKHTTPTDGNDMATSVVGERVA